MTRIGGPTLTDTVPEEDGWARAALAPTTNVKARSDVVTAYRTFIVLASWIYVS
jgi:hypothetical protein